MSSTQINIKKRNGKLEKLNINKINHHIIGGAKLANELDAKSAIDQGCRLAAKL